MKILQVVDLLRHRLVRLKATSDMADLSLKQKILLKSKSSDQIVARVLKLPRTEKNHDPDYSFVRPLKLEELKSYQALEEEEKPRVMKAQKCADKLELPMKFFASRTDLEGNTYSFFFTSEHQIDFRELLKLMVETFGKRIHLERVGARDKAKIVGGFGVCGRETCCSTFKVELDSIPMDAARDQNLKTKDNERLFGLCGKLKCCLVYELPEYRRMRKFLPHIKQSVETKKGKKGRVVGLDILNQKVKVLFDGEQAEVFDVRDLKGSFGK